MRIEWMWENPEECEKCGGDLVTQEEIEQQICDECNQEDAYEDYLKYGVAPGEKEEEND